ncbi:uncharacterized protein BDR25DRAFT_359585 [Lindgomyces ingoldianus]|uniref:Uncharacterized protein n=1 Tax=Lindgomyces ingoldianus TaxID=673940 RepID=A0ACB6QH06_9PLEO|nr:uncharacterized protein BDR25DRAFT_359585 [Lindgomyces ingoldianus]KAF2466216.1 hypothetical protein BDR25DRAFT_359585 [Lindgomyces ingoldianus]
MKLFTFPVLVLAFKIPSLAAYPGLCLQGKYLTPNRIQILPRTPLIYTVRISDHSTMPQGSVFGRGLLRNRLYYALLQDGDLWLKIEKSMASLDQACNNLAGVPIDMRMHTCI